MRYSHVFFFRRFGEDGAPLGPALAVTFPSPPATNYPEPSVADVATLPGGGFIVVWSQDLATVPPSTVQALVLDAQGFPASSPTLAIDTDRFSGGMLPRVFVEPDGSCNFLWMHGGTLAVRRLDPSGLSPTFFWTAVQVYSGGFEAATDQHGHLLATAGTPYGFFFGDLPHFLWRLDDSGHESTVLLSAMDTVRGLGPDAARAAGALRKDSGIDAGARKAFAAAHSARSGIGSPPRLASWPLAIWTCAAF